MTREDFQNQMDRLATVWGRNNYHQEVISILWRAFATTPTEHFTSAIDNIMATHPARHKPPLLDELSKAVEQAKVRSNSTRHYGNPITNILENAANYSKADKELVKATLDNLKSYQDGKITKEIFMQNCDALDTLAAHIAKTKRVFTGKGDPKRELYNA